MVRLREPEASPSKNRRRPNQFSWMEATRESGGPKAGGCATCFCVVAEPRLRFLEKAQPEAIARRAGPWIRPTADEVASRRLRPRRTRWDDYGPTATSLYPCVKDYGMQDP